MIPENRRSLVDHASETDLREIPLNRVGISGLQYPIKVLEKGGQVQQSIADVSAFVGLPANQRGTHMSRLVECIHAHQGEMTIRRLPEILGDMRKRLVAPAVEIKLEFPYFVNKYAPVSGVPSLMNYQIEFWARLIEKQFEFNMSVEVPVKSLCPCSKGISDRGAHNQRSKVAVRVTGTSFVWIEDIIEAVEEQASAPLFALLKREDEKYVTELAYDQAKFAEDLARDTLTAVRGLAEFESIHILVENQESIHNHQAFAEVTWRPNEGTARAEEDGQQTTFPLQPESFGEWLRNRRESRAIPQAALARQLNVTPSHLSKLEGGQRLPSADLIENLASALGVESATLHLRAGRLPPSLLNYALRDPQALLDKLSQSVL